MSESTIRRLCWCEYDFAAIDAKLSELAAVLAQSGAEVPACAAAAEKLDRIRYAVRSVLAGIDAPLTDAVLAAEALPGAPF